ncbi:F0F1 ATP synthase subunit B family protein [Vacuolonema iberomarrocanum]|uniref:F0F1 ATP synthase subunit B family protein n=1 Tax=Vacuolonema iberomarrocanum TaxID=3454632 RepID=UPI0019DA80A2|nr:F0F1 ATP synthase subunit B [filamentous cyanobacterium LEGE 07170]
MLIDWFTVVVQIINFLILLFLLHRFLYRPILKTIDKRQAQMEARWRSAQDEKDKAEVEAQAHRQAQQELQEQREQILAAAQAEAQEARRTQLQAVRQDIQQKRQEWQRALADEQQSLLADLQQQFGHQVMSIVRQILQDLADTSLEQQAIRVFQQKLHDLDDETRQAIADTFANPDQTITIQTALDLSESSRESLCQTLQETHLVNGQVIQFDRSSDVLFGIRLQNDAYDLTWNADDYLKDLEKALSQPTPATDPHPSAHHDP